MGKRLEYTPNSKIRQALRKLSLWSRERSRAMKNANYSCQECGVKRSTAKGRELKVEAHHIHGIDWDGVCDFIRERILQKPEDYQCLCEKCHALKTEQQRKTNER